jgi:hypothetical protein
MRLERFEKEYLEPIVILSFSEESPSSKANSNADEILHFAQDDCDLYPDSDSKKPHLSPCRPVVAAGDVFRFVFHLGNFTKHYRRRFFRYLCRKSGKLIANVRLHAV